MCYKLLLINLFYSLEGFLSGSCDAVLNDATVLFILLMGLNEKCLI